MGVDVSLGMCVDMCADGSTDMYVHSCGMQAEMCIFGLDMGLYHSNPCDVSEAGRQRQLVIRNSARPKLVLFMGSGS